MFEEILRLKHGPVEELARLLQSYNPGAGRFLMRMMAEMWQQAADGVLTEPLANPDRYFEVDAALQSDESATLIMRADPQHGGVLTEADEQRALALLGNGTAVYFPGAGHAIHATRPVEFAATVREFVGIPPGGQE
jgi:pimeloyl-ACP methyl ester carboxylesterase